MTEVVYYFSVFFRRLPLFLPIVMVISAVSVIVAMTLPPAYVSKTQVVVESPQIPDELAPSTVRIPPREQLEIIRQRLLTRVNLLEIARRLNVLPGIEDMNPDEIVDAMRARTQIKTSGRRDAATLMWIEFEAPEARTAAAVLTEYLTLIQKEDAQFRQGRAGETLEFFEQQVAELGRELDDLSARILGYKNENTEALPETLEFRLNQQEQLQKEFNQIKRDVILLTDQKERLITLYETPELEQEVSQRRLTPEEQQLEQLRAELQQTLAVFSEEAPKVKLLRARIASLESNIDSSGVAETDETENPVKVEKPSPLTIQLSEIDSRLALLEEQKTATERLLKSLNESIKKTPEVSIRLEELERQYQTLQQQFALAQDRLSTARTGELIETRSRGQEISVIDPPAVPSQPTKPNRLLIAGGGVAFSILAGLGLVFLLEAMNTSARRPEDIVKRFNIMPISTIPFIRTRRQVFFQRGLKLLIIFAIIIGVPMAVYAVHTYYTPLDLLAERVMNKLGIRL